MAGDRPYDLVLFGASGFVGRLLAHYLRGSAPAGTRVALAGRSRSRLEAVLEELGPAAGAWGLEVVDAADRSALQRLARSSTAVATTVGPYARYGDGLVEACAAAGTHYADLCGEILFVRRSVEVADAPARASGARIVHACGYDSVPSDLGLLMLAGRAEAEDAGGFRDVVLVARARGGFSGGTIDSFRAQVDEAAGDPMARRVLADPYALSPNRPAEPDLGRQPDIWFPRWDPVVDQWTAPFVMGAFNSRIVRRSNALTGWRYGRTLRYREVMGFGRSPHGALAAGAVSAAVATAGAAMALRPTRVLLDRLLPAPGAGPSVSAMDAGWFRSELTAVTGAGRYRAVVAGEGDPGYRATAVMMGEAALALALDGGRLPDAAGVLTPATGLGAVLVARLEAAGLTLRVESSPAPA